eukprot:1795533-Rhodomonas_salina.2
MMGSSASGTAQSAIVLRACYAMSSTDTTHAATDAATLQTQIQETAFLVQFVLRILWEGMMRAPRGNTPLSSYALAMQCPVLTYSISCNRPTRWLRDVRY